MKNQAYKAEEREQRQWWVVDGDGVKEVTGYSCAPSNPDFWWCPAVGYSCSEEHHLFKTRAEALWKAITETHGNIQALQERKERLEKEYWHSNEKN